MQQFNIKQYLTLNPNLLAIHIHKNFSHENYKTKWYVENKNRTAYNKLSYNNLN